MALTFPDSPTIGDLYTAENGVVYEWNGTTWDVEVAGTQYWTGDNVAISYVGDIDVGGSASFTSAVQIGNDPRDGTNAGTRLGTTTGLTATGDIGTQYVVSLYNQGVTGRTAGIQASGAAQFAGNVLVGDSPNSTTESGVIIGTGGSVLINRVDNSAAVAFSIREKGSGNANINMQSSGTASFAGGDIQLNDNGAAGGKVNIDSSLDGSNSAWGLSVKNNDGRAGQATLKLQNIAVDTANALEIVSADGTTVTTTVRANGDAFFANAVTSGPASSAGFFRTYGNVGNNTVPGFRVSDSGGTKATIWTDGSAAFTGTVLHGVTAAGGTGGNYMSSGEFAAYSPASTSYVFRGWNASGASNANTSWIKADGNAYFAGNITAANVSDIKFKENITDANPQLADVTALGSSLKNWDWKEEAPLNEELKAKRFLGLIAQEAEQICPGVTYEVGEGEDSYKAINHDILVMKLLGAVAEQQATIESLEARITQLETPVIDEESADETV